MLAAHVSIHTFIESVRFRSGQSQEEVSSNLD
jgi:hypothetical protein